MALSALNRLRIDAQPVQAGVVRGILRRALEKRIKRSHSFDFSGSVSERALQWKKLRELLKAAPLSMLSDLTLDELLDMPACGMKRAHLAIEALRACGVMIARPVPSLADQDVIEAMSQFS